jgi:hypothetical protein
VEVIVDGQLHSSAGLPVSPIPDSVSVADRSVLQEEAFRRILSLETKRAERSQKPFLLTLLTIDTPLRSESAGMLLGKILSLLASATRETDVSGWYKEELVVGVMFTEIAAKDRSSVVATIMTRLRAILRAGLTSQQFGQVGASTYVFPEERNEKRLPSRSVPALYSYHASSDEAARLG